MFVKHEWAIIVIGYIVLLSLVEKHNITSVLFRLLAIARTKVCFQFKSSKENMLIFSNIEFSCAPNKALSFINLCQPTKWSKWPSP